MKRPVRAPGALRAPTVTLLAIVAGGSWASGCGGGSPAGSYRPPITIDAGAAGAGGAGLGGAGGDALGPPMSGPGTKRILAGAAELLKNGQPCTSDAQAGGDMWCAVLVPSTLQAGLSSLYVVNVSQAVAGTPISCGNPAGDPNCLILTAGFVEDDSTHAAGFQGNTLIYFDSTATPWAWRPGMVNGRRLVVVTSDTGDAHSCVAAPHGDLVACLQDVTSPLLGGGSTSATYSDLLVGQVGPTSPPLPRLETVISNDSNDEVQRFQIGFVGPSGDRIAWSTRTRPGAPEVLYVQSVGPNGIDETSRLTVATDVSQWTVSPDGTRWAWLSKYNYDSVAPAGASQIAAFPSGDSPVTILATTTTLAFVGKRGLAVIDGMERLFGLPDLSVSMEVPAEPLDENVIGIIAVSSAGHLAYVRSFDFVFRLVDLFVTRIEESRSACALSFSKEVPFGGSLGPRFLPNGQALLWARVTNLDTTDPRLIASGKITRLADCSTQTVESDLVALGPLGADGVSISDSYDGSSGTLRFQGLTATGDSLSPGTPTLVQTRMNASLSLYPFLPAMLYTVSVGDPADGLYVWAYTPPAGP